MKKFFTALLATGMLFGLAADISAQDPAAPAAITNAAPDAVVPPEAEMATAEESVEDKIQAALTSKETPINHGDTAWMIVATALVLFMTLPGLALFYGGLVRQKNVLSVLMQCFAMAGIMTLLWVIYGYSLAFGTPASMEAGKVTLGSFIGDGSYFFLKGVTNTDVSGSIPLVVFITFQMTFAIITPALIVGAFAERMKFSAMVLFCIAWFTLSYLPICHMAWAGKGALFADWGVLDFAGGTVVHINAGIAGLVACILVGKRLGYGKEPLPPHSVVLTVVGASMLWVGWFGFNAGSELAADGVAGMALLVTQVATGTAAATWMLIEWFGKGKPTAVGIATGAVAGLVAITPASGTAGPIGAIAIGFISSIVCYIFAVRVKAIFGYDDSLDVFGVHGIGGIVGALMTGICASTSFGGSEEIASTATQVWIQFKSVIVTIIWSGVVSVVALKAIDAVIGLRVSEEVETAGLDLVEHGEEGYHGH